MLHQLKEGASLRLEDLALLMIAVSDNSAANLLIDRIGIDTINNEIRKIGMKSTILGRKMLDFEAKQEGKDNFTTPEDLSLLFEMILTSSELSYESRKRIFEMMSVQKLNSKLPSLIAVDDVDDVEAFLAHKTGELPSSEHDAGIFFYNTDHPVLVTVMTQGLFDRLDGVKLCSEIGSIVFNTFGINMNS